MIISLNSKHKYSKGDVIIQLKDIRKVYGEGESETIALKDINLSIRKNEFLTILGPSGSGKSTLLHILGLLDRPTKGSVFYFGTNTTKFDDDELSYFRNKEIGFVFQSFNLIPSLTAYENIEMPMIIADVEKQKRKPIVEELLKKLDIYNRANHYPNQLSGGEMQRVAVGRALANNPDIIFADEPTGNLDSERGKEVMKILTRLNNEGKTIIVITHDPIIAKYGKRTVRLKDGNIVSDGLNKKR